MNFSVVFDKYAFILIFLKVDHSYVLCGNPLIIRIFNFIVIMFHLRIMSQISFLVGLTTSLDF